MLLGRIIPAGAGMGLLFMLTVPIIYWYIGYRKLRRRKHPGSARVGVHDDLQTDNLVLDLGAVMTMIQAFSAASNGASLTQDAKLCLWLEKDNNLLDQEEVSKRM